MLTIKKRSRFLQTLLIIVLSSKSYAANLPDEFPLTITFRAFDGIQLRDKDFNKRLNDQASYDWIHQVGYGDKARAIHAKWPNKVTTLQYGYGGLKHEYLTKVWPGHLLYKAGTLVTKDISPNDTIIQVQDYTRIAKNNAKVKQANQSFPFSLILYAVDQAGKPDWSQAEHIVIQRLENDKLVVQRGQWGSKPLAFKAGKAVVAAHMMFWTSQWQLNFSVNSPRGGIGNLTAQEWFAKEMQQKIIEANADGIEFDVGRWTWGMPEQNPMDVDNNLVPDYGYINGVNSFGLGGQLFFRELRKLLGPNKIIQVDSNSAMGGVRGWNYINGIQLESYPTSNDFNRFSEAFLLLRLWSDQAKTLPRLSYPFSKTPTTLYTNSYLPDGSKTDFRFRVGLASACLTGMPHSFANLFDIDFDPENPSAKENNERKSKGKREKAQGKGKREKVRRSEMGAFSWDEYHGGDLNKQHWLGRPKEAAKQDFSDLDKTDLLAKANWQWKVETFTKAQSSTNNQTYSVNVTELTNATLPKNNWFAVRLENSNKNSVNLEPGRQYTLEFEARGDDSWNFGGQTFEQVPRMITISAATITKNDNPMSILVDNSWRTYRISFTADNSHKPTPTFGFSEQIGKTEIRNIKLYAGGAERWSREFDNGLVLLNMANKPWTAKIRNNYYKFLKGSQTPEINTGQNVADTVTVPPHDALFLVKR